MTTLVTELTALDLIVLVMAGNCYFSGIIIVFLIAINDPNEQVF